MENLVDENKIRLGFFLGGFLFFTFLGLLFPRRKRLKNYWFRKIHNIFLILFNSVLLYLFIPLLSVPFAFLVKKENVGILNWLSMGSVISIILTVVLMDFFIYIQHRVFHLVPVLWRLHRVHHIDIELDASTGLRFHPLEIFLSLLYKFFCIFILGAHPLGVLIFEVILNFSAMFNHENIKLPSSVDHFLRKFIVTPDFHRIHHSVIRKEECSNYGFCLSTWDILFKTKTDQPRDGQDDMVLGVENWPRDRKSQSLFYLLKIPFMKTPQDKSFN